MIITTSASPATHDHHDVGITGRDRVARLGDELLRALSPNGFQHHPGGIATDALHHRPRVVVRFTERGRHRTGDLELSQRVHGVDGLRDASGACIGQRRPHGFGRQLDRGHAAIVGVVDALGELADADDDRSPRIDHYRPPDAC
jgi:hypothetical protein